MIRTKPFGASDTFVYLSITAIARHPFHPVFQRAEPQRPEVWRFRRMVVRLAASG